MSVILVGIAHPTRLIRYSRQTSSGQAEYTEITGFRPTPEWRLKEFTAFYDFILIKCLIKMMKS